MNRCRWGFMSARFMFIVNYLYCKIMIIRNKLSKQNLCFHQWERTWCIDVVCLHYVPVSGRRFIGGIMPPPSFAFVRYNVRGAPAWISDAIHLINLLPSHGEVCMCTERGLMERCAHEISPIIQHIPLDPCDCPRIITNTSLCTALPIRHISDYLVKRSTSH